MIDHLDDLADNMPPSLASFLDTLGIGTMPTGDDPIKLAPDAPETEIPF